MRRSLIVSFLIFSIVLVTSGCRTFTKLDPKVSGGMPAAWTAVAVPDGAVTGWIADFKSRPLKQLVEEAVGNNFDLQTSLARVKQAAARARISGADRLPQVSGSIAGIRSQRLRGSDFAKVTANQFSASLDLSWEIDLWGRLANAQQSTLAELEATQADFEGARLSLAAQVIQTALNLVEAQEQAKVSEMTLESLRTNLAILDGKLEVGDIDDRTALEITLSRSDVLRSEASLAANRRQADAARRFLETLLGRYPKGMIAGIDRFPNIKSEVPAGLPSQLLLRRPDLIAAERRVEAAVQDVAVSWKAMLPSFSITGSTGTSTTDEFKDLLDPKALVWDIAGRMSQAIFQGGRLKARVELSKAQREEIAARYAEVALRAFREVETALAAETYYREQQHKLEASVEQANIAESLAQSQFEKGIVDIITVLESQRRAFDARSNLLRVTNERLQNRVDLYLALGGDFNHPAKLP